MFNHLVKRRQVLKSCSAGLVSLIVPNTSFALGEDSKFGIAEIILSNTLTRPSAWQRGLFELQESTSIEVNEQTNQVRLDSVDLFNHPFTVVIGEAGFEPLTDLAVENLRRYLTYGGFIIFDDASGRKSSEFLNSVQRLSRRVFPNLGLNPLPKDHSLYRSFFLLESPKGRFDVSNHLLGVHLNTTTPFVVCQNDLSGALLVGDDGQYTHFPVPDGEYQRRESIKLFINLVLYALTSNYKHDQVHVAELLRRGGL